MINLNKVLDTLTDKPIYYGLIAMLLTIYGPRLHPKLPDGIRDLFNNSYFRFSIIAIIIYLSNRDLQLALLISIMFVIIMSLSNSCHCHDVLQEKFGLKESYSDFNTISEFYEEFNNGDGNKDEDEDEEELPENQVQNSTDDNPGDKSSDNDNTDSDPNSVDDSGADADPDAAKADPDADAIADAVAEADAAVASSSSSPDSSNDLEKEQPKKSSVETYMSQGAEVMGGLMNKVKGILTNDSENVQEKYTNRPSLYETFQNVNVDFEDGSTVEDQDKIEKFISNNTNSQLHQYENFLKKTVNQYKFL